MAGAVSLILIRTNVSDLIMKTIEQISSKTDGEDFWINETKSINGSISSTTERPFIVSVQKINSEYFEYSADELNQIKQIVGHKPEYSITISAMCNDKIDHRILGELSLYLAEKFDGIIDFGGAIYPYQSLPSKMKEGMWLWEEANWTDIKPYFEEMVEKIDGKIFTIEYETANNRNWASHLCDAEFMKNWLQNVNFGMIK